MNPLTSFTKFTKLTKNRAVLNGIALTLTLVLSACGGGGSDSGDNSVLAAVATGGDVTCGLPNFQDEMTSRVNAARAAGAVCGGVAFPPAGGLRWNTQLQNAATAHSEDMASHNFFAHQSPTNGSTLRERVPAAGYKYSSVGENLGAGQASIAQVVSEWLASPSHCATLMKANFIDMGVSCKANAATTYGTYWTMELGVR